MHEARPLHDPNPPTCGMCRRSLLVGEGVRLYRDRDRTVTVCELCESKAIDRGFEALEEAAQRPVLRVLASGAVRDLNSPRVAVTDDEAESQLGKLRERLERGDDAPEDERAAQGATLREVQERLVRQERELQRLRRDADPVRHAEERRQLGEQGEELRQLRERLRSRERQVERLQFARRAETSPAEMCTHAIRVFNASEEADRIARISRTLGDPQVSVRDEGAGLPRRVRITFVWEIAWYEFLVKLDLGSGKASVTEDAHGGDPSQLNELQREANTRWRESGLVFA